MSGGSITDSPFLRPDIIDRLLVASDPVTPFFPSDPDLGQSTPSALFGTVSAHCRSLDADVRKSRSELLSAKLHLLVNTARTLESGGTKRDGVLGNEANAEAGTTFAQGAVRKAAAELEVLQVRLEVAVLGLVRAAEYTGLSKGSGVLVNGATAGLAATDGQKWKEAEAEAAVVNTECTHLARRLERAFAVRDLAGTAGQSGEYDGGSLPSSAKKGRLTSDADLQPQLKGTAVTADPLSTGRARSYETRAVALRLAALEVLARSDGHYGRTSRVERWNEQMGRLRERLAVLSTA